MSLFYTILGQHQDALIDKGYNEQTLNSPNRDGLLLKQLKINFSKAMNESFRFNEKVEFELHATATLKNNVTVEIYLHYCFDNESDLQLRNVKYYHGDWVKEVPISILNDLPYSKNILDQLEQKHKPNRRTIASRNRNLPNKGCKLTLVILLLVT